jgi:hypothetical protein
MKYSSLKKTTDSSAIELNNNKYPARDLCLLTGVLMFNY